MCMLTSTDCVEVGAKLVGQLGFVCDARVGSMGGFLDGCMRDHREVNWVARDVFNLFLYFIV